MRNGKTREWPFYVLAVAGSTGGALLGGYLGYVAALASDIYWPGAAGARQLGPRLGIAGGLLAGVLWSVVMVQAALRQLRRQGRAKPTLLAWGAFAGHGAAIILAAVILVGLQCEGKLTIGASEALLTILVGSAAVGLPAGLAMGVLAWGLAALVRRRQ
jgi:hypothetical protein